ncbi:MAG: rRNA adenine dimethylase [Chitinivibrionales bacterium]|nr:rRNA adenine dimethylase [Chitinivibrionales bacterium]
MKKLCIEFAEKAASAGIVGPDPPVVGAATDRGIVWNRADSRTPLLEKLFSLPHVNGLFFSMPGEPYATIMNSLAAMPAHALFPKDWETRVYFHDIPIVHSFRPDHIVSALTTRKSAIVPGEGIITVSDHPPKMAYVYYSSVCFALFIKFFADYLDNCSRQCEPFVDKSVFHRIRELLQQPATGPFYLRPGPLSSEKQIHAAICEAGKRIIDNGLVDSCQGNISYRYGSSLAITCAGAHLDELAGNIIACPLDKRLNASFGASSELPVHRAIAANTPYRAIIHSHPKFAVILSMDCSRYECTQPDHCYTTCSIPRTIGDIPVVSGEGGSGPHSISATVPPALGEYPAAIVYGHGLFTVGNDDFCTPFNKLVEIENYCRKEYFRRVNERINKKNDY